MSTTIMVPLDQVNIRVENGFLSLTILHGAENVATEILEKAENQPEMGETGIRFDADRKLVYWDDKCVKLPFKQFQIVHFLWTHGPTPLDVFAKRFWGDELTSPHTLSKMRRLIQLSFLEHDIDCSISYAGGVAKLNYLAAD